MTLIRDPRALLVLCGVLLGFTFPLAKLAGQADVSATTWIILNSLGASITLLPLLLATGSFAWPQGRQWRYVLIAGPLTFAVPNFLVFLTVPNVGAGYGGLMFALSPVCTMLLANWVGVGEMNRLRYIGLLLGLLGAMGISLTRDHLDTPSDTLWILIAALLPVMLAIGNLYRSLDWPGNAAPELLAFWSHTFAVVVYGSASWAMDQHTFWQDVITNPSLSGYQLLLAGFIAPLAFRLQRFGGPVMLSQIGYVAAATSLAVATVMMGEHYPLATWLCALLIVLGIIVSAITPPAATSTTN